MRAFLALELDHGTRRLLTDIQSRLEKEGVRGNFSSPENLHLTLKFLGEIDTAQIQKIRSMIKNVAELHHSFVLTLNYFGKFDKGKKMILWAGMKHNEQLFKLYDDNETRLGFIMPGLEEKSYSPHITLVREAVTDKKFYEIQKGLGTINHTFPALGLSLMESTRKDGRLTYVRCAYEAFKSE